MVISFPPSILSIPGLNHLQGEYWIATHTFSSGAVCVVCLNHLQGEYWIATSIRNIRMTAPLFCLNHLQGEYWIATQNVQRHSHKMLYLSLNHLQGEYWIATLVKLSMTTSQINV